MNALLKPFAYGLTTSVVLGLTLWLVIPLLFWSSDDGFAFWYMGGTPILPLLAGGFVSARYTLTRYRVRKLLMGAAVGATLMLVLKFVSSQSGEAAYQIAFDLAGTSVSVVGAFFSSLLPLRD